jgi:subtilisin family serine protease
VIVMTSGQGFRRRAARLWLAVLAAACAFAPAPASGAIARPGDGDLSPRLAELAKPSVRSAPRAEQAVRLSVARKGPGSLLREGNRVLVEVRFDHGAAAGLDDLRAAGAKIVHLSRRYQTVAVAAKPSGLPRLDHLAGVHAVTEVLTPIVHAAGGPGPVTSVYTPCFGLETSEGDEQLRANEARAKYKVEGSGVKVGILSDSFDQDPFTPTGAAEDVASGDLPGPGNLCGHTTPVEVLDDSESEGADEGRAMAQVVHDLAPGAALSFATAFSGETGFADNIRALAEAGATAIVDDVSYPEEPFFQEGPIGVAVSDVTSKNDVAYFSAAGNDNLIDGKGNDIASWEAPEFRDSLACPSELVAFSEFLEELELPGLNPDHCMDFNPGVGVDRTFSITVEGNETLILDLQWAEPWEGVTTDLDAFLLNSKGEVIGGSVEENVAGSKRPLEIFGWENESASAATVRLVVNRFEGDLPRLKFVLLQNGGGVTATEYPKSSEGDIVGPAIFGHNGGEDTMSIGAIRFNTKTAPEKFSSRGPVTHYFEPVEGTTPAGKLPSPEVLAKPDVVATDGGANTFFGSCSKTWRFFGTSAAAPHAAAVAALEQEAEPAADAAAVKKAQIEAATAVGVFPPTAVGSGLVDAVGTLEELVGTPPAGATLAEPPPPGPCLPARNPVPPPQPNPFVPVTSSSADTSRPRTFFRRHPPKTIRTDGRKARAIFRFGSNEEGVTFVCRIDGGLPRFCAETLSRRFSLGRHTVRVRARDLAGNVDPTPAVFRFQVKRVG